MKYTLTLLTIILSTFFISCSSGSNNELPEDNTEKLEEENKKITDSPNDKTKIDYFFKGKTDSKPFNLEEIFAKTEIPGFEGIGEYERISELSIEYGGTRTFDYDPNDEIDSCYGNFATGLLHDEVDSKTPQFKFFFKNIHVGSCFSITDEELAIETFFKSEKFTFEKRPDNSKNTFYLLYTLNGISYESRYDGREGISDNSNANFEITSVKKTAIGHYDITGKINCTLYDFDNTSNTIELTEGEFKLEIKAFNTYRENI